MTFLNPLLALGLLLAALPILIHLLARRRLRRQPFSTLDFLKRLQTKRMRHLRLRQWLLLALRTLAVLLLAFAFLRPAQLRPGNLGTGASETVILLDLSASMVARDGDTTPLDRARAILRDLYSAPGAYSLVVMDENESRDVASFPGGSPPTLLDRLAVDGRGESLVPAWQRAAEQLRQSPAPVREMILLSDFRFPPPDTLPALPSGTALYHVDLSEGMSTYNAWIESVQLSEALMRSGQTLTLQVRCRVSGGKELQRAMVTVSLGGKRVAEGELTLQPDAEASIQFPIQTPGIGFHPGEVVIELSDALALDNRYPFVLNVPGKQRVLLAGDDLQALRYLELALNPDERRNHFDLLVRPGGLRGLDLRTFDVILLAGWQGTDLSDADRLVQFVHEGGGIWVMLSSGTDLNLLSRSLLRPLGFGPASEESGSRGTRQWREIDLRHPALANLLEGERFDRPSLTRMYTAHETDGDHVLIRTGDGQPFLLEREHGRGRAWWTPAAADPRWTDWPISGVFAPMLQQGVTWLAGGAQVWRDPVPAGEELIWLTRREGEGRSADVRDPLGNLLPAVPEFRSGRRALVSSATWWPGHYSLQLGDASAEIAAVRLPSTESHLGRGGDLRYAGQALQPEENQSYGDLLQRLRSGRELSSLFLLLALLALIAETLLAREGRERTTPDGARKAA